MPTTKEYFVQLSRPELTEHCPDAVILHTFNRFIATELSEASLEHLAAIVGPEYIYTDPSQTELPSHLKPDLTERLGYEGWRSRATESKNNPRRNDGLNWGHEGKTGP